MSTIDEKRVYADRTGRRDLFVASAAGLARVAVSGDQVGEFGLVARERALDVATGEAATGDAVAVATGADVLVGRPATDDPDADADGPTAPDLALGGTGFGRATAVGVHDGRVVAAGQGRVARYGGPSDERDRGADGPGGDDGTGDEWTTLGSCEAVRAVDGDLLAAADGCYRLPTVERVGLDDVRDVARAGALAATGEGLYALGTGGTPERVLEGATSAVASDGDRAHAVREDGTLLARADEGWEPVALPVEGPVADVAYAGATCAVTTDGTVCVEGSEGWRSRSLGLPDVRRVAASGA
jgi:hypothetical protein